MSERLAWWVNVTVAGLIAAAAFVAFSETFGWPDSVSRVRFLPVAVHLAVNALLLMGTRSYSKWLERKSANARSVTLYLFHYIGLLIWSGVNAILAIEALITLQASKLPIVLLAIPGTVGLWVLIDFLGRQEVDRGHNESDQSRENGAGEGPADVPEIPPQSGINEPRGVLKRMTVFGVYLGAVSGILVYGYAYWNILSDILIKGKIYTVSAVYNFLLNPWFLVFPLALVVAFSSIGVIGALGWQIAYWRTKPSRHALSEEEQTYIREAFLFIKTHLPNKQYSVLYPILYYGSFIFLFVIPFVLVLVGIHYMDTVIRFFEAIRTEGLDWYLYIDHIGASELLAIPAICAAYISAAVIIMHRFPRLSEYAAKQLFFHSEFSQSHEDRRLVGHIAYSVRTVNLETKHGFKAEDLPRLKLHFDFTLLHVITVLLVLATGWLWYHDRWDYDLFTEDYIEYVDYWTLERFRMPYDQAQNVEVGCTVDAGGDPSLTYIVHLNERHFVNLWGMDQFDIKRYPERLADYEKLNRKLRHTRVRFMLADQDQADVSDCMRALRKHYGADLAPRILRLLYELHPR